MEEGDGREGQSDVMWEGLELLWLPLKTEKRALSYGSRQARKPEKKPPEKNSALPSPAF